MQVTTSPTKFASLFNAQAPSYREITSQDIIDLTTCGLVGKYKFYCRLDIEIIRGILMCERLKLEREQKVDVGRT